MHDADAFSKCWSSVLTSHSLWKTELFPVSLKQHVVTGKMLHVVVYGKMGALQQLCARGAGVRTEA